MSRPGNNRIVHRSASFVGDSHRNFNFVANTTNSGRGIHSVVSLNRDGLAESIGGIVGVGHGTGNGDNAFAGDGHCFGSSISRNSNGGLSSSRGNGLGSTGFQRTSNSVNNRFDQLGSRSS
ncbi:hypothetical protein SDC9_177955 [bioreactor metagenome]|uniref:Uncharacterized protein n=1 Tax=bioreactor metagenome TaxID=1076179 RepID=A0A645H2B4_9ZZZZ